MTDLARWNQDTQVIIDHVGLARTFVPPAPPEPFADLPNVPATAEPDNVVIKISGVCTCATSRSHYPDIRAPLRRVFDAHDLERCLWGTGRFRAVRLLTCEQGVEAFRATDLLPDTDRAVLMGPTQVSPTNSSVGRSFRAAANRCCSRVRLTGLFQKLIPIPTPSGVAPKRR